MTILGDILVCPETRQTLTEASRQRVNALNKKIEKGTLYADNGDLITVPLDGGLLREDKKFVYPVRGGIAGMHLTDRIPL